jgi:hypothetical protein
MFTSILGIMISIQVYCSVEVTQAQRLHCKKQVFKCYKDINNLNACKEFWRGE